MGSSRSLIGTTSGFGTSIEIPLSFLSTHRQGPPGTAADTQQPTVGTGVAWHISTKDQLLSRRAPVLTSRPHLLPRTASGDGRPIMAPT